MYEAVNQWILVFLPILGIGLGIIIAIALTDKVGGSILRAFKDVPDNKSWLEHQRTLKFKILIKPHNIFDDEKLKNSPIEIDNWQDDDEKPKRQSQPEFILGDDGELLEVIDDKPKRGLRDDG